MRRKRKMSEQRWERRKQILLHSVIGGMTLLALLILAGILILKMFNGDEIIFSAEDGETVTVEYGKQPEEVRAWYRRVLISDGDMEIPVTMEGEYDPGVLGTYRVSYSASYRDLSRTISRTIVVEDRVAPELKLVSDPGHYTSPGNEYEEEGYSAVDNYDGDLTDQVVKRQEGDVITYSVTDSNGNTATATREIVYKDVTAPEIRLKGKKTVRVGVGGTYKEKGCTAMDDCDGDLTGQVKIDGQVDTGKIGEYVVTYSVQDSAGNTAAADRKVRVVDTVAPTLSLKGDETVYVQLGQPFEDPGCEASDNLDGDISDRVEVGEAPDTDREGTYEVKYSVKDSSDNEATATRKVIVTEKQEDVVKVKNPGDKVVYLTFDDGPGKYTQKLLDVLDKYNVKVTFFVTNQYPEYQDLIRKEYEKGHTVAIHSYSHDYAKIYQSQEAFYDDIQKMSDICYAQTSERPAIIRFPGGSSNTISAHYRNGIMTELTQSLGLLGYLYCDWNVSSGDAGETTDTSEVADNVIAGIKKSNVSVVLQHDIKDFSVDAVEEIVAWGLANGYTFLPLDTSSPMVHHGVNN